ncbi:arylamine N-acetyltransferase family protein [Paenibacillus tarimensis]|uniref:arylamine N-acetyltransferase family protein n=1 Tax=Paenibacillus tarimensis TaxID=416012 RepID=UPI001F385E3A|nr:arylamine N-acetyltransferase [Paenibacillus tarimensis]MCF2946355.1 arylamine N-acetyltransferase [Paenibacillus tarimensis]
MDERLLDTLFRKRIGYSRTDALSFTDLNSILELTGRTLPFENMSIIENRIRPVTRTNLTDKVLINGEGGLCYELNTLFHAFLLANGFEAVLVRGIVYYADSHTYAATGRTHVTILLKHEGRNYLADTGFGGNLPLRLVPTSGEPVESANGLFRVRPAEGDHAVHGDYMFEMKLRHKDHDWHTGYVFDSGQPIDLENCNTIQRIVAEHPGSTFNKRPLFTRLTPDGSITLTDTSLTISSNGLVNKTMILPGQFEELRDQYFR